AVEFLVGRTKRDPRDSELAACEGLARMQGGLPLALELAAALMLRNGKSFAECLRTYETFPSELLSLKVPGSTEYPVSVVVSLQASTRHLAPDVFALLRLLSMIATTPVAVRTLSERPEVISGYLGTAGGAPPSPDARRHEFWL